MAMTTAQRTAVHQNMGFCRRIMDFIIEHSRDYGGTPLTLAELKKHFGWNDARKPTGATVEDLLDGIKAAVDVLAA